jgi:hypothetical protein
MAIESQSIKLSRSESPVSATASGREALPQLGTFSPVLWGPYPTAWELKGTWGRLRVFNPTVRLEFD